MISALRTLSIRAHLLLLAAVSAVPLIVFGAVLLLRLQEAQVAASGRDVVAVTRALSLAIDNHIAFGQSALEVLAQSPNLAEGRLDLFHAEVAEAARLLGVGMSLSSADGAHLLTSQRPYGTALEPRAGTAWSLQAVREGRPVVSDVFAGSISKVPVAYIEVPVTRGVAVRYVLAGSIRLDVIDELIRAQRLPPDWVGGVIDRQGRFVQRTRDNARWLGQPASAGFWRIVQSAPEGWERNVTLEGVASYTAFTRSERTGWSVGIAVPESVVWAPLRAGLLRLLGVGVLLAAAGAGAALWLARRIARPIAALAAAPDAVPALSRIMEVEALASALVRGAREREAAVAALRESEAELRAATDHSPQRPWTAGPDGRLLTSSKRVTEVAGVERDALLGEGWLSVVHPDDQAGAVAAWARCVATGAIYSAEFRVREKDGSYVWTHARAMPRKDAEGRVVRWYGSTEPIQARKAAEQALQASQAELQALAASLEARVAAEVTAREAVQARLAQSQRMQALGQLASGIAHDFNNVLQAVGGGLHLIRKRPDDPALVLRISAMAADATARGAAITGRLLSLSRQGELRAGPVDAPALLHDIAEVLQHTLGAAVTVQVEAAPGLPPLLADQGQLETVLINLATNARDAMPGGGTLTLGACVREAGDGGEGLAPGHYVVLSARDTGDGMPSEVLARASEPFFTTKEVGKGTGLGLAMAHGFAEQSGGRLQIESALGEGTAVSLWLPCAGAAAAGTEAGRPEAPAAAARVRILLVDDDALVRGVTAATLEDLGYAVSSAADGADALALLRGEGGGSVSLLVSDLSMPGMDGVALIRAAQAERRLPAILMTGYAGDAAALAVGGAVSGSFSLLQKPVTAGALADRIATLLADKEA